MYIFLISYWYRICTGKETFPTILSPDALTVLQDAGSEASRLTVRVCALPELNPSIEMMVTCQGGLSERQPAPRGEQRSSVTVQLFILECFIDSSASYSLY